MKRFVFGLALITAVVVSVSSCKTHEKCPAYSKVNASHSPAVKA